MKSSSHTAALLRTAAATFAIALAATMVPMAEAGIWSGSTGGAMCKGSSGTSAPTMYYANTYAQNTSAGGQYVTCGFTDVHAGTTDTPSEMYIGTGNPTDAPISFNCAIQSGYAGGWGVIYTTVAPKTVAANTDDFIYLDGAAGGVYGDIPAKGSYWAPYSLTCLVPPQGKIGLLHLVSAGTL